jgi:cytochrome P450
VTIDLGVAAPAFPMPRAAHDAPPVAYATLRRERPVVRVRLWNGSEAWLVTRYDDVRALLSDDRFSAVASAPGYPHVTPGREVTNRQDPSFIQMDGAEHDRQRRMVNPDFVVKRVATMRPRITAIVYDLLDRLVATEPPVDLVSTFALPLPALVICEILGVPPEDREYFHELAAVPLGNASLEEATVAMAELKDYLDRLIAAKEQGPGDDLLSRLAVEQLQPGALTRAELVSMALLLLVAGHETTANMISLGTYLFLENPDQGAVLRTNDDPRVVERAIEELLRYMTIVQYSPARVATVDVELGGQVIRAGEGVFALIESANRDDDAFAEPDVFDIRQPRRHHVAFGYGRHQCLGQWLARLELQVALPALFRRIPALALAPTHEVRFKYDMTVFGIHELRVVW